MTISELIEKIENLQQYEPCINDWKNFNEYTNETSEFADMEESTMGGWISVEDLRKILKEFESANLKSSKS